jgi:hypothetical protein
MTARQPDDYIDILYKHTGLNGAVNILINQTLPCASASKLNDPFDVLIGDWIGLHAESHFRKSNAIFTAASSGWVAAVRCAYLRSAVVAAMSSETPVSPLETSDTVAFRLANSCQPENLATRVAQDLRIFS